LRWASDVGAYCAAMLDHYASNTREAYCHDQHLIMWLIHPELFRCRRTTIDVETAGNITTGATVADWGGHWRNRVPQTTVLLHVDSDAFYRIFLERIAQYTFIWAGKKPAPVPPVMSPTGTAAGAAAGSFTPAPAPLPVPAKTPTATPAAVELKTAASAPAGGAKHHHTRQESFAPLSKGNNPNNPNERSSSPITDRICLCSLCS
jgi:hypothetical protein